MADTQLLTFLTVLLPAAILGIATKRAGLSSVVGFVAAGILVGPVFGLIDVADPLLGFLSQLGIILVTFQIGLTVKLDFIRNWGSPAGIVFVEALAVVGLTFLAGALLRLPFAAVFVLTFMALNTSTAVVFHLLEEEHATMDRSTRDIVFGVGAFEDILSLIGLALLPLFTLSGALVIEELVGLLFFIVVSIALMLVFGLKVAKYVIHYFGLKDTELLIILSASLVIAYAFIGELIGLSPSLGAFIAGLAASSIIEAEEVKERFLSFTEIAALFFFAFIGVSLPRVFDLPLVVLIVGIGLVVIAIKFASFSLSSWLLGARLEDSFRMGLYMIAISEFGIIIALEGFRRGAIGQEIYLVSVVVMVLSTIIASSLRRVRDPTSARLASLVPKHFRAGVESTMGRIREAFASDRAEFANIRVAAWELLKRGAIVTALAFLVGFLTEALPPLFGGAETIAEVSIITIGSLVILATVVQSRDALHSLIDFAFRRTAKEKGRRRHVVALVDFVHFGTIGLTAFALFLFYSPFILNLVNLVVVGEAASILVVVVIVVLFVAFLGRINRLMRRIDHAFRIEE